MSSSICLNCNSHLNGEYCHHCGQKAATHRFSILHFIQHDFLHGIFHFEKGIFFTLKELMIRPGRAAREYVAGKRVKYFSILTLLVLLLAFRHYVVGKISPDEMFTSKNKHADNLINETIEHYYKSFFLLIIPLISGFSILFFKRLKFNYAEHLVINSFLFTGCVFYSLLFASFEYLTKIDTNYVTGFVYLIYFLIGYYQLSNHKYTIAGYLWRAISTLLLFVIVFLIIVLTVIFMVYGGNSFNGSIAL